MPNMLRSMPADIARRVQAISTVLLLILIGAVPAGAAQFSIQAKEVEIDRPKGLVVARGGVRVTDGKVTLTSREMTLDQNRRTGTFTGQVRVVRPGEELAAEVVIITLDAKNTVQQVTARNGATVTTKDFLLSAREIQAMIDTETVVASGNVRLLVPPDVLATAGRLTYTRKTQEAVLEGNPRVQSKDGYLSGERLTVWVQTQKALASGSVKGEVAGVRFSAAEARMDHKAKTVFLRGDVEIRGSTQQLRADSVTVYYGERRMIAEGEVRIRTSEE
jgi:lipopolysaccharide export system protein LptA